jgi:hypothetical protein
VLSAPREILTVAPSSLQLPAREYELTLAALISTAAGEISKVGATVSLVTEFARDDPVPAPLVSSATKV